MKDNLGQPLRTCGIPYDEFISAMTSSSSDSVVWQILMNADLVLGGPALNEDFSYVYHCRSVECRELSRIPEILSTKLAMKTC